jgi:hypothetical protein
MALAGPPAGTLFSVCLGVVRGFRGAGCCRLGAWVSELVGWIRVTRWADSGGGSGDSCGDFWVGVGAD